MTKAKETKGEYVIDFISGQKIKANPEEIEAVQVFARQLVEDYCYPKEHIQTRPQFRVRARPSDTKKEYPVDIAIFLNNKKQEDDIYIIVECKKKNRKDGRTQLQDYLRFSKAFLGVWFNGDERLFLRKVEDQSPDYYIPKEIYDELRQDIRTGDVLFSKDGKVGMSAIVTKNDKTIIASGLLRLRLKAEAKKNNLTSEYLFIVLSTKETGLYPAIRRTVIASTIPQLRDERLGEIEILILDKNSIDYITKLVKDAFELKDKKKKLIKEVTEEINSYFS